jgi:hypothetical protein
MAIKLKDKTMTKPCKQRSEIEEIEKSIIHMNMVISTFPTDLKYCSEMLGYDFDETQRQGAIQLCIEMIHEAAERLEDLRQGKN